MSKKKKLNNNEAKNLKGGGGGGGGNGNGVSQNSFSPTGPGLLRSNSRRAVNYQSTAPSPSGRHTLTRSRQASYADRARDAAMMSTSRSNGLGRNNGSGRSGSDR